MSRRVAPSQAAASTELHRQAADRVGERDQRYTTSRRRIVDALAVVGRPVTLPELLAREPRLAQSSAYRNLAVLEEAGVVRRLVHGPDHAHYELAEDLTEHHHHLICVTCGTIRDVTFSAKVERSLDTAADSVAAAEGFTPLHHALDIYGHCSDCATNPG